MAACKPRPVDRSVLAVGAQRSEIVASLGAGRGRAPKGAVTRKNYTYTDGGAKNAVPSKLARIVLDTS